MSGSQVEQEVAFPSASLRGQEFHSDAAIKPPTPVYIAASLSKTNLPTSKTAAATRPPKKGPKPRRRLARKARKNNAITKNTLVSGKR